MKNIFCYNGCSFEKERYSVYIDYKELGQRIAKRRRELGLKQSQVNEMAGLSDKYLSNIERATSVPSLDVFMKLCAVLRTTPDKLLIGSESPENISNVGRVAAIKIDNMTRDQQRIALSLLDWVAEQKL